MSTWKTDPALAAGIVRGDNWTDAFGGFRTTRDLGQKLAAHDTRQPGR
jgi:hypothetical protein